MPRQDTSWKMKYSMLMWSRAARMAANIAGNAPLPSRSSFT